MVVPLWLLKLLSFEVLVVEGFGLRVPSGSRGSQPAMCLNSASASAWLPKPPAPKHRIRFPPKARAVVGNIMSHDSRRSCWVDSGCNDKAWIVCRCFNEVCCGLYTQCPLCYRRVCLSSVDSRARHEGWTWQKA